jgi:hypothetical protein
MRMAAHASPAKESPDHFGVLPGAASPIDLSASLYYTLRRVVAHFECYYPDGTWVRGRKKVQSIAGREHGR